LTREEILEGTVVSRVIAYRYDAVGNRLERNDSVEGITTYTYNGMNQLASSAKAGITTTYTYDDNGSLIRQESPTKLIVNQWNSEKRLVGVTITENGVTKNIQYRYNTEGIRTAQIVDGQETRYLIDVTRPYAQVREEYQADGDVMSYVSGLGGDILSQVEIGDNEKRFYVADYLDSTRLLTNGTSGLTGDKYVYDAYGRTLTQTGISDNSYRFAGEAFDDVTGLQYLRDRYMDPNTARFTRRDSFSGDELSPISTHPYLYASNNPVTFTDPSGFYSLAEMNAQLEVSSILNNTQLPRYYMTAKKWIDRAEGASDLLFVAALFGRVGIDLFIKYAELSTGLKDNPAYYEYLDRFAATDGADGALSVEHGFKKPIGEVRGMDIEFSLGNLGELISAGAVSRSLKEIGENLAFKVKGSIKTKDKEEAQFSVRFSTKDGLTFGSAYVYKLFEFASPKTGFKRLEASLVAGFSSTYNINDVKEDDNKSPVRQYNANARAQMSFNAKFFNFFAYDYPIISFIAVPFR
jgi:RHS repeat-associated protein